MADKSTAKPRANIMNIRILFLISDITQTIYCNILHGFYNHLLISRLNRNISYVCTLVRERIKHFVHYFTFMFSYLMCYF